MRPFARLALALCAPLVVSAAAHAAETTGDCVRVTVEIGRSDTANKTTTQTYEMLGAVGTRLQLTSERRLPVPGTPREAKGPDTSPAPFAYHGVGVKLYLETTRHDADRVRVAGRIEASVVRTPDGEIDSAVPPVIGTFSTDLDVVARPGKPVRVVTANEPPTGQVFVSLKVDPVN